MEKIDIIMCTMSSYSDWEKGVQNRNFHIFNSLKKRKDIGKIILVDFLPINLKQKLRRYLYDLIPKFSKRNIILKNASSLCYQVDPSLFIYSTAKTNRKSDLITKEISTITKKLKLHNPLIWSYDPLSAQFLKLKNLSHSSIIFDTVDNWIEHNSYSQEKYQHRLKKNYFNISKISNIIFTVSKNLNKWYKHEFHRKDSIHFIPNGIDSDYFTQENITKPKAIDFFEQDHIKNRKVFGYIGTIQSNRVDIDLIKYIAQKNPKAIIAICGPIWNDSKSAVKKLLSETSNVYFLGKIPRHEWLDYCMYFDVALNPHKVNDFTHYTSPTKIFEYLAAGKPVVTTPAEGTQDLLEHIYTAETKTDFNKAIQQALSEDSTKKQKERISNAQKNFSWDSRVEQILNTITHHSSFNN